MFLGESGFPSRTGRRKATVLNIKPQALSTRPHTSETLYPPHPIAASLARDVAGGPAGNPPPHCTAHPSRPDGLCGGERVPRCLSGPASVRRLPDRQRAAGFQRHRELSLGDCGCGRSCGSGTARRSSPGYPLAAAATATTTSACARTSTSWGFWRHAVKDKHC